MKYFKWPIVYEFGLNARRGIHIALLLSLLQLTTKAQMITGNWSGHINHQKVELKIVQQGDSLTGTSYYYESANNYRRYTIKGYFKKETNEAVWWDDQLLEERTPNFSLNGPGKNAVLAEADFNCPGDGRMMLDGKTSLLKEPNQKPYGDLHLDKADQRMFEDEWDFILDNYTSGANDPELIDSIESISRTNPYTAPIVEESRPIVVSSPPREEVKKPPPVVTAVEKVVVQPTIEEKFTNRKKIFTKEIPVSGDSIELRFYDNAEIDGDSISLFLNDKLIFEHIRLLGTAYTIKIAVKDLKDTNELIMVAENLGSIPPNTSYMVAIVDGKRYDARLESTEGSSAMIRLRKQGSTAQ